MAHHIPEHKIIIVQTVIFIGLLVLLSFILDGCTSKHATADSYVESAYRMAATDPVESPDDCGIRQDCPAASAPVLLAETLKAAKSGEDPLQKGITGL